LKDFFEDASPQSFLIFLNFCKFFLLASRTMSSSNAKGSAAPFGKLPDSRAASTSVTIKGLPPNHHRADCMGEYTKTERILHGRSVYMGGCRDNMALWFDGSGGWVVNRKAGVGGQGFAMVVKDSAVTPDRITSLWFIDVDKQPDPSVRVRKFKSRDTTLVITGLSAQHIAAHCMGLYTRQALTHDKKPTYKGRCDKNMTIWFHEEGNCWCVGSEEAIGTFSCSMFAFDTVPTPDAVLSTWNVLSFPEADKRVQVCSTSTESTTINQPQQQHSALPTIAVVGQDPSSRYAYAGVYTKQLRKEGGMVVYEGGLDGKQAVWQDENGWWRVGEMVHIGTDSCHMYVKDPAAVTPDAVQEPWQVPFTKPCSSVRVTKSKKKHTKVVEVKGMPTEVTHMEALNGKYRQQGRMIGGRLTFKGGQHGNMALWYDKHEGKWCGSSEGNVGTGLYALEAKDTALTPDKVKATWQVISGFKPSPYPNIIVPSVEAVEQEEVPRLLQLKMSELMAAQHRRCLGCGHEYTAAAEVVFHCACMHHHCVCCKEEVQVGSACAVCAQADE
jgi:hypothetical protein